MTKTCTKCKRDLPANSEYFYKEKAGKFGLRSKCKECMNAASVENVQNKAEYYREKQREYRKNSDTYKNWDREYQKTPQRQSYLKRYNRENKDRRNAVRNDWLKRTGNGKIYVHKRRAALKAGGSYTQQEWIDLVTFWQFKCIACGVELPIEKMTPDHVIPLELGGLNIIDNIQPMCRSCNSSKQMKTTDHRVCEIKAETS